MNDARLFYCLIRDLSYDRSQTLKSDFGVVIDCAQLT